MASRSASDTVGCGKTTSAACRAVSAVSIRAEAATMNSLDEAAAALVLDEEPAGDAHGHGRLAERDPRPGQLLLGATGHGHLGMGVDDRGYGLIANPIRDAEHRVHGDDALAGGRVGEHVLTGDVAARPQPGDAGLALLADPDARGAEVDADLLQAQPSDNRGTAGGVEDALRWMCLRGPGTIVVAKRSLLDSQHPAGEGEVDPASLERLEEPNRHVAVTVGGD